MNFICDYTFIYGEYLLTYSAGTILDHTHPRPPPPPGQIFFPQIWILCQNSLSRVLKIRVVGFVLKKLFSFFGILIVPHTLHCIDGCFFVFDLIGQSGILFCFSTIKELKRKVKQKMKWKKNNKRAMMALGRSPEYHWNQIISNLSTGLAEKVV